MSTALVVLTTSRGICPEKKTHSLTVAHCPTRVTSIFANDIVGGYHLQSETTQSSSKEYDLFFPAELGFVYGSVEHRCRKKVNVAGDLVVRCHDYPVTPVKSHCTVAYTLLRLFLLPMKRYTVLLTRHHNEM